MYVEELNKIKIIFSKVIFVSIHLFIEYTRMVYTFNPNKDPAFIFEVECLICWRMLRRKTILTLQMLQILYRLIG